ncbi:MAG TPA: heme-binding protein [Vicinamibacterales bacterium]|nr:heme-binding protein [Vicinamibacterales bacterium]
MLRKSLFVALTLISAPALAVAQPANQSSSCSSLPNHGTLKAALDKATAEEKSGLNNHMWATIVDRDGVVCAVAFSGTDRAAQWPGSRVISAQKANTANAFSLDSTSSSGGSGQATGLALSTANLYSAVQPGGSLFGLQFSNPVHEELGYSGPYASYGTAKDPMVGGRIGGVNVFGGGLGLYGAGKRMVGGLGVSGDTSCADHNIAWHIRSIVSLDHLMGVGGVSGDKTRPDNIVFDIANGASKGGFGHPQCLNTGDAATLPAVKD